MNKNFWKDFKYGILAVKCKTEEEAEDFLTMCRENCMVWNNGDIIIPSWTRWSEYKEETTYSMCEKGIAFGNIEVCELENVKVVDWEIGGPKEITLHVDDVEELADYLAENERNKMMLEVFLSSYINKKLKKAENK